MPHLQTFYEENRQDEVEILSINLTQLDHGLKTIQNFIDNYQLTFPVALDKKDIVGQMYEIMTIPTTFFIDENGVIQQKIIGPMDKESMKQAIETFWAEMKSGEIKPIWGERVRQFLLEMEQIDVALQNFLDEYGLYIYSLLFLIIFLKTAFVVLTFYLAM